ncbi:MAG: hypothetical protein QW369_00575 [Desulfurococcaceae archaeon]
MEDSCRDLSEAISLMKVLLIDSRKFFHNEVLNSDGRKLYIKILRAILKHCPKYRRMLQGLRGVYTLEAVIKVAERILGMSEGEIKSMLSLSEERLLP